MASQQLRRDEQEEVVPKLTTHLESVTVIGDEQQGVVQFETMHAGIQEQVVGTFYSKGGQQMKGGATQLKQISEQMKKKRPPGAPQTTFQKKNDFNEPTKNNISSASHQPAVDKDVQQTNKNQSGATSGRTRNDAQQTTDLNKKTPQTDQQSKRNMFEKSEARAAPRVEPETGKTTVEYGVGAVKDTALVAGLSAASLAANTAKGVTNSMENFNAGVGAVIEGTAEKAAEKATATVADVGTAAKDAALVAGWGAADTTHGLTDSMENVNAGVAGLTASAAELAAEKTFGLTDTAMDVGKKGATYIGEKIVEGKTTAEYAGKAAGVVKDATFVGGRSAAKLASHTACGVEESMRNLNVGVGELIEDSAIATEIVAGKAAGLTLETGKTTADLVGKSAGVLKDAALAAGRTAIGLAANTATGLTDSMETINVGVAGLVENTAAATEVAAGKTIGLKDTVVDAGKKGASYIGDRATGKTTAKFVGQTAGVVKDAALVGGWSAAELATDTAAGVKESVDNLNYGVAGLLEGTAEETEVAAQKAIGLADTMVSAGKKGATYIGENVVVGKDVTLETGRTTAEYVGQAAGVVKDAALVAGWNAAELASDTAEGVKESMGDLNEGVSGLVEGAAVATAEKAIGLADSVVDAGKRAAVTGKDMTLETGKNTAEYVGSVAAVLKDAALGEGESGVYVTEARTTGGAGMDFKNHARGWCRECGVYHV